MSDPRDSLPPELEALYAAERARPDPDGSALDRMLDRFEASVGDADPSSGSGGAPPASDDSGASLPESSRPRGGGTWRALTGAFAVGLTVGALGMHAIDRRAPSPTDVAPQQAAPPATDAPPPVARYEIPPGGEPQALPPSGSVTVPEPAPVPTVARPEVDATVPTTLGDPAASTPESSLTEERRLIDAARTALARRAYDAALAAVRSHAARFPRGTLTEEREAARVQALAGRGDADEARRAGRQFEARFPTSIQRGVVARALRALPPADGGSP